MKAMIVNRSRALMEPVWPHRKGLRAPAVHAAYRSRDREGGSRGSDRAAQAMAVLNKTTVH